MADSEDEDAEEEEERGQAKERRKLARQRSQAWLNPKVAQRVLGRQKVAGT